MTPQTLTLDQTLRWFVAAGSGLDRGLVIPGNSKGPRPKDAYASLLLIDDNRLSYPIRYQQPNDEMTSSISYRRATYSLQFYRDGAAERARDFCIYAESENGLTAAEDGLLMVDANWVVVGAVASGGFRVVQTPPLSVQRLDEITGDAFEERALVNLPIDYAHTTNTEPGYIDAFECEISYDGIVRTGTIP